MAADEDTKPKDILSDLDHAIEAIETHKDWRARQQAEESERVEDAWNKLTEAARQLRKKLAEDPRVRYFSIARDGSEVSVSFHKSEGGSSSMISMYRTHPEGKFPMTRAIWIRRPGEDDHRVSDGDEAVDILVKFCARNLAHR